MQKLSRDSGQEQLLKEITSFLQVSVKGDTFRFKGKQGEAIGRTEIVDVTVSVKDKEPVKVQVGGNAVIVFKTEIEI